MARNSERGGTETKADAPKKKKGSRASDDLDLVRVILEENPKLKARVMYFLESALGKVHTN